MLTQLETDKVTVFNRLTNHRSKANNTVSALIRIAETSPNAAQIWTQVEDDFVKLAESPTRDVRILTPQEALKAARELEWRQIKDVAASFGRNTNDINRYRELLGASLSFTLQRRGLVSELPPTVNQIKYQQIAKMHQEADTIAIVVDQPQVKKQLDSMPDLKVLLESYQQYSTVRLFLEENGVPYNPIYVRAFNTDLQDYLFGSRTPKLALALRRATLGRWIKKHTNWYNLAECEIDEVVSRNAQLVYSSTPPVSKINRVRHIRWFLNEAIAQEFTIAKKEIASSHIQRYSLSDIFVPLNGNSIDTVADIDKSKTFRLFARSSACPEVIKSTVEKYLAIHNPYTTYDDIASEIYKDLAYAPTSKKRWIEGGFTFLENALLLKPEEYPSWEKLTRERRDVLRRFRETFQRTLKTLRKQGKIK